MCGDRDGDAAFVDAFFTPLGLIGAGNDGMLGVMEATWAQLLLGLLAVIGVLAGAAVGGALLACTPLRRPADAAVQRRPRR